jgi:hypothetical protein
LIWLNRSGAMVGMVCCMHTPVNPLNLRARNRGHPGNVFRERIAIRRSRRVS